MLCSVNFESNLESKPSVSSSRRMKSERISARKCSGSVDKQESITHANGNDDKSVYMTFSQGWTQKVFKKDGEIKKKNFGLECSVSLD